jgi:mannose-6-phosphate isomerase-like protein (cupin superfamily)
MGVRRVVTGQNAAGKAVVVSDEVLEPGKTTVMDFYGLWGADEPPHFPQDGSMPDKSAVMFPGPGGYRFFTWTLAPNSVSAPTAEEFAALPPDIRQHMEGDEPGMHNSDTVDLEICLSGEASLEFDDGAVVHLQAGDYLVQNGTRHRWFNRGDVPAIVAGVIIGGHARGQH